MNLPFILVILDGLALNPNPKGNAVFNAKKPTLDKLFAECPHTTLVSFGKKVGLPEGQMGNSEVGHLNIGGGRVVQQQLTRINQAIEDNELATIKCFSDTCAEVVKQNSALHFIGLTSDGGVHSQLPHLQALIKTACNKGVKKLYIHAITDGRDRPQSLSVEDIEKFNIFLKDLRITFPEVEATIVSVIGRFFAMDRDKRWERTEKAYQLFTEGKGELFDEPISAILEQQENGITAEFIEPLFINHSGLLSRKPNIQNDDAVIFYNFRADRMRQIVSSLLPSFNGFKRHLVPQIKKPCTLTQYDETFDVNVLFPPVFVKNHFGQVLSTAGIKQLRIAETEKYAHVTYFFNGGEEEAYPGEERILVQSPKDVTTYDLKPEMSAYEVTEKLIANIRQGENQVFIINFANCDMVGHTGNYEAAKTAVETVDKCLGEILKVIHQKGGIGLITADHGNADQMIRYETGEAHTFHTTYPVPLIVIGDLFKDVKLADDGALCDIAPTACKMIGLATPPEMTGKSLIL